MAVAVPMVTRYATARELRDILESAVAELCEAIGLGFLQMSLPVDSFGRAQDFIEVQVSPDQLNRLPSEVAVDIGGETVQVRLRAVQPVQQYVPLAAGRD